MNWVQSFLGELVEGFIAHRFATGQMDRVQEAKFRASPQEFRFNFMPEGVFESDGAGAADSLRLQQALNGSSEFKGTSSCGSSARKGKSKGKGKGANRLDDRSFDEVCRLGRRLTDFERDGGFVA